MQSDASELAMTFNDSYARVMNTPDLDSGSFFATFYKMFSANGEVREKFKNTDPARQIRLTQASAVILVAYYGSGLPDSRLKELAKRHSRRGVDISPRLYTLWLDCLVEAVHLFDPKFNVKIENAWRAVFSKGIAYMLSQYEVE